MTVKIDTLNPADSACMADRKHLGKSPGDAEVAVMAAKKGWVASIGRLQIAGSCDNTDVSISALL